MDGTAARLFQIDTMVSLPLVMNVFVMALSFEKKPFFYVFLFSKPSNLEDK